MKSPTNAQFSFTVQNTIGSK